MHNTLRRISTHIQAVQMAIRKITDELTLRGIAHDESKFTDTEIYGYLKLENFPQGLEYGSEEYKEAFDKHVGDDGKFDMAWQHHATMNSHHPEHFMSPDQMGLVDIIEMVCDWQGAHVAYGNDGTWEDTVRSNISRYEFTSEQVWAIKQVAALFAHDK